MTDLRVALRRLRANPAFSVTAIVTIAVGVGATMATLAVVNAVLLRPLPYLQPDGIYTLNTAYVDGRWSSGRVAATYLEAISASAPSVVGAVAVSNAEALIFGDDGRNRHALLSRVSEGFFDLFGRQPAAGRFFVPADHGSTSAVISYRLWTDLFGQDPGAIGRSLAFATGPMPIVGVAPADFDVPPKTDVWVSMTLPAGGIGHNYQGYLRAHPETTERVLHSELAAVMATLEEAYPQAVGGRRFVVRPLLDATVGDLGPILLLLLAGAVVLLVVGSLNVATLFLTRGATQAKELAVRAALGAGHWSGIRTVMLEPLLVCACGGLLGLGIAWMGVRGLLAFGTDAMPRLESVPVDPRVLWLALGSLASTSALTSLLPALRLAKPDLRLLLRESGRSTTRGPSEHRLLRGLVCAEIALAIPLVAGAGWLVRSYLNLVDLRPGFEAEGRLVLTVQLMGTRWAPPPVIITGPDGQRMLDPNQPPSESPSSWLDAVGQRLAATDLVESVGSANVLPLGTDWDAAFYVAIPGEPYDSERQETARLRQVSPTFFEAMGTRLLRGRDFDVGGRGFEAIVNEAFVRRYLPSRDPLGASFSFGFPVVNFNSVVQIAGVVEDVRYRSLQEPADPTFYLHGMGPRQSVVVKTTLADPTSLVATVLAEVRAVDPSIPVTVESLSDVVDREMVRHRVGLTLMTLFALVALGLASVGIYGVVAHVTGERSAELATRMALGASPAHIRRMILREGSVLLLVGAGIGVGIAYLGGRVATSRLYEVRSVDPAVLVAAVTAVLMVALFAFLVPAVRISRLTPTDGLGAY